MGILPLRSLPQSIRRTGKIYFITKRSAPLEPMKDNVLFFKQQSGVVGGDLYDPNCIALIGEAVAEEKPRVDSPSCFWLFILKIVIAVSVSTLGAFSAFDGIPFSYFFFGLRIIFINAVIVYLLVIEIVIGVTSRHGGVGLRGLI